MDKNPIDVQVEEEKEETKQTSTLAKAIVLVVLVVLLVVGILLPIKLVPNAVSSITQSISSLFGGKTTLSVDKPDIQSGETVLVSWNGKAKTNGSYALSYECTDGVRFETSISQPNEVIQCDSTYYFLPTENTIDIKIFSNTNRFIDVPVSLGFLPANGSDTEKLAMITLSVTNPNIIDSPSTTGTITPTTSTPVATTTPDKESTEPEVTTPVSPTPTPTQTTPKTPAKARSNPNGTTDLQIIVIGTGYINRANGQFVRTSSVQTGARGAIKFQIINMGDKNSGTWRFSATLPSSTNPNYISAFQQNLGPKDRIEYILSFDNFSGNTVTITADSTNAVVESNEINNIVSTNIYRY